VSGVELALRAKPPARLNLWRLTPDRLFAMTVDRIERLSIGHANHDIKVGDLFRVRTIKQDVLRLAALDRACDGVARGLGSGTVEVEGDVGAWAGAGMTGGLLRIHGGAGAGAGASMTGGLIDIGGDAGDYAAGPKPAAQYGMSGGVIVVRGKAGDYVGARMRRGLVVVGGRAGDDIGARMVAGTIVLMRGAGARPGVAMRRGSLVYVREPGDLPPSYVDCGIAEFAWLRLLGVELARLGVSSRMSGRARRFMGDMAAKGKGEILLTG
jgi:formylmethanofuran dehydrogenase subunit C